MNAHMRQGPHGAMLKAAHFVVYVYGPARADFEYRDFETIGAALDAFDAFALAFNCDRALVRAYSDNGRDAVTIADWSRNPNATPLFV